DGAGREPRAADAAAKARPLERPHAVHAAAAEAGRLARGVQAWDRLSVGAQHPTLEVGLDAAEALARHHRHADGDQRHRLGVDDLLEAAGAEPVAAPVAELLDAAQLVVVEERLAAVDVGVVARD